MTAKILVVDDEPQFERLLRQRLRTGIRERRYDLTFAQNGLEALEILAADPQFDIILSDINMPKMDGLTLLGKIKESGKQIRAVMVSAYGDMSNIRMAMNLGAYDFVTKPINFEDLEITINKTLEEVELTRKAALAKELELMNEKLRELDRMKSQFFTNISHEFRTPLTIISGMIAQIRENPERWFREGLKMIERNSEGLLQLVNQILDLAKLEAGKLQLNLVQADVIPYLKYLLESFQSLAGKKNIRLDFQNSDPELVMDFDPERLLRIVSNLVTNAIKFTPPGGRVLLKAEMEKSKAGDKCPDHLFLAITDTGIGIPEGRLPFIFERFYQVDSSSIRHGEGTGIGLALTKELVQLMKGEIQVESREGAGTTFRVILPVSRSAARVAVVDSPGAKEERKKFLLAGEEEELPIPAKSCRPASTSDSGGDRPTVLIAEDNPDIVEYLRSCLESNYELLITYDGQAGIARAIEEVPDLIVSDVMMPVKDGFELCETLKTDERTSHIPIILLTAKADQESRLQGLTRGADAYLAKPFDKDELNVRLEQLLALRRRLQERYRDLEALPYSDDEAIQQEDAFLQKVRREVEKNIDDEDMSIAGLARAIGVSRAQLHSKISALTGRSPSVFVRTIRLHRAKELLKNSGLNISQIAFEVGFRDPAYFSRTFSEEFGYSPKEARK